MLNRNLFGPDFIWGVSSSATQTEGAWNVDGKGHSIWDTFVQAKNKIAAQHHHYQATEFYHRFEEDIALAKSMNIKHFRFSFAWSRILPDGIGTVNQQGIDYYKRVIKCCKENDIEPWVTLYHWDLPQALEARGGWTNREILHWFEEYVNTCMQYFKDDVNHWMILNEPVVFTGAGYFLGIHAPGKRGLKNFLPAVHHAVLCQALGFRIIKKWKPEAQVGSTFSCSYITPYAASKRTVRAAQRVDKLLNCLFLEPALGLGYPYKELPIIKRINKYMLPGDELLMKADLDFIGIQNYTREVIQHSFWIPFIHAKAIPAAKRKVYHTAMGWEVYPESIYHMIKKYSAYTGVKKIIVTENGAAFQDSLLQEQVNDPERIEFLSSYLAEVARAKREGAKVNGYFVWSLTDNFEWAEGYHKRFGLVYIDFETQQRTIKASGYWYKDFLS